MPRSNLTWSERWRGKDKFGLPNWVPEVGLLACVASAAFGWIAIILSNSLVLGASLALLAFALILIAWSYWRYHKTTGRWRFTRRPN
jgi:amino acid transporter